MILVAQVSSSLGPAGRQIKIFRRLGVSPGTFAPYGPAMETVPTPSKKAWFPVKSRMPSDFTVSFKNVAATM